MNLTITENAKKRLSEYQGGNRNFLRIAVVSGGCSGMSYSASVESEIGEKDEVIFEDGDFRVIADPKSALFLDGLHIDYSSDLIRSGFRLTNPNAASSCACGSSFSV